jgi:carbamoyl-phosphate synthase small subunit
VRGDRWGKVVFNTSLTGYQEISSHNHGFAVRADSLPAGVEITHSKFNDGCAEGVRTPALGAFSVQYHPEAVPGLHDAQYLCEEFVQLMETSRSIPTPYAAAVTRV